MNIYQQFTIIDELMNLHILRLRYLRTKFKTRIINEIVKSPIIGNHLKNIPSVFWRISIGLVVVCVAYWFESMYLSSQILKILHIPGILELTAVMAGMAKNLFGAPHPAKVFQEKRERHFKV